MIETSMWSHHHEFVPGYINYSEAMTIPCSHKVGLLSMQIYMRIQGPLT